MRLVLETAFRSDSVHLYVRELAVRPDNLDNLLLRSIRRAVPGTPRDILRTVTAFETTLGWPASIVRTRRAVAVRYDMLHFVAVVVAIADDEETLAAHAEPLRATLMSARPDFTDSGACLSDFWADD